MLLFFQGWKQTTKHAGELEKDQRTKEQHIELQRERIELKSNGKNGLTEQCTLIPEFYESPLQENDLIN
ncbi:hypothetical protein VZT92_021844 [Zoarces viviparus]|uniref:Uncharacterized protein n=1 Tax=Zoarces viviparus TaxID=48416 RepID=A0AAW1E9N7_ZOAVI